jgi:hypothetical protein
MLFNLRAHAARSKHLLISSPGRPCGFIVVKYELFETRHIVYFDRHLLLHANALIQDCQAFTPQKMTLNACITTLKIQYYICYAYTPVD